MRLTLILLPLLLLAMTWSGRALATTPTYTTSYVWDANRRLDMVIQADTGTGVRTTSRFDYDVDGNLIGIDKGTTTQPTGSDFAALESVAYAYDLAGREIQQELVSSGSILTLSQTGYDPDDRVVCSVVRLNPTSTIAATPISGTGGSSLPTGACALTTTAAPNDRITQTNYDAAGQKLTEVRAYLTASQITYEASAYTLNGKLSTIDDANGDRTTYLYDGFDRLQTTQFPVTTAAAYISDTTDYEAYSYDANDNRLSLRKRDGSTITYSYDNLDRQIVKHWPTGGGAQDVYTQYDLLSHATSATYASTTGIGVSHSYDLAGRVLTEVTYHGQTLTYAYDAAGNRTKLTWPDGFYAGYCYDADNHMAAISQNDVTCATGVLVSFSYDTLGRRGNNVTSGATAGAGLTRGNGATTAYAYDAADRLTSLGHTMAGSGTGSSQTLSFAYNPASQLLSALGTNPAYAFTAFPTTSVSKAYDGLNRDASIATVGSPCAASGAGYDCNGNLTYDGTRTFTYDTENRLISANIPSTVTAASLTYDPLGRLRNYAVTVNGTGSVTSFLYDGDRLSGEYDGSGNLLRRYIHGPGTDEPLVWLEGPMASATVNYLHADHQGSIIAWSTSSGAVTTTAYGAYGEPQSWSGSRFSYTGQIMLPELKLYHYKARVYDPASGRFLQTDPVGYDSDIDLYAYVGDDPVDRGDPTGESWLDDTASFVANVASNPDTYRGAAEAIGGALLTVAGGAGDGASAVAEGGSLGLASPVALPAAAVSTAAVVGGIAISADGAKTLNAVFSKAASGPGSYTNTHESGKTYSGKGSRERSQVSGRRVEKATGDKHVATDWKASGSEKGAFKDEAQRIKDNGGAKSPDNYNKNESPGKKYLDNN